MKSLRLEVEVDLGLEYSNNEVTITQEDWSLVIPEDTLTSFIEVLRGMQEEIIKAKAKSGCFSGHQSWSNIVCTSYNKSKRQLKIEFSGSGWYVFDAVPESVWEGISTTESADEYFHANVHGKFSYRKVV